LTTQKTHIAAAYSLLLKFIGFSVVMIFLTTAAFAQNTKGDKPVKNGRVVRETKGKSVKKKEKGRTRDIANRRLRTKGQSSANRANTRYRQSTPYSNRSKKYERAAAPRGRTFSQSPIESKTRAWKGDVSGYPIKRIRPGNRDAARTNVYPQSGPFVKSARKQPEKKSTPVYTRTIKGKRFINHSPKSKERAWKGGVDRGPIKNQSATSSVKNTYSQKGPYVKYYRKNLKAKDKSVSNRAELQTIKSLSRKPLTGGSGGTLYPASASRPFLKRGKKNVYWGKFSKKEKPFLRDLTGGPLRTRNFKTAPNGLTNRDTLQFFGRKPKSDRANRVPGGGFISSSGIAKGWRKGDISGWRLRRTAKGHKEVAGKFFFLRKLSISGSRETRGNKIPGSGFKTATKRGEQAQLKSISAIVLSRDLSGKVKHGIKPPKKGGGSILRKWNNDGQAIAGKGYGGSLRASRYQGNMRPGAGFQTDGVNYSGRMKRNSIRGFSDQGVGSSGTIKRSNVRGFSDQGVGTSGNIRRTSVRGFSEQGIGYSGRLRSQKPRYGGGSISGRVWNNNNRAIDSRPPGSDMERNYSGNIKFKRQPKGGGSVSGKLWNNQKRAIDTRPPGSDMGGNYSGNIKFKRPEKGGGSVSGKLFNNDNRPLSNSPKGSADINYSGRIKFKRPEKGGGSVSGILWNNNNQPLNNNPPKGSADVNYTGRIARSRFKKDYIQNPNASKESIKKHRPDGTTYLVAGLQVKVREKSYKTKPNAAKNSLPGIAPSRTSVKASEYSRSIKQYWDYKHSPNGSREALKVRAPERAYARIGEYQGNVKMHKYSEKRLHPDAQFAHGLRDNVKEERTLLMNVKLIWAKLFRKSETQPENLKERITRPKYDKREKGMWNN